MCSDVYVYARVHKLLVYIVGEDCVVGLYTLGSVCLPRHNQLVCLSSGNMLPLHIYKCSGVGYVLLIYMLEGQRLIVLLL